MSSIMIGDLARSPQTTLDRHAMAAIRGGQGNPFQITVSPQITVNQSTSIAQNLNLSLLNGTDLSGMQSLNLNLPISPTAIASNVAVIPDMRI
jgi:hypothetical protein